MGLNKKKKKAPEAQHLIDSLLDERTPSDFERDVSDSVSNRADDDSTSDVRNRNIVVDTAPHFQKQRFQTNEKKNEDQETKLGSGPHSFEQATTTKTGEEKLELTAVAAPKPPPAPPTFEDRTVRIESKAKSRLADEPTIANVSSAKPPPTNPSARPGSTFKPNVKLEDESIAIDRMGITELKTVVKMRDQRLVPKGAPPPTPQAYSSPEAVLKQSENLRIAQSRINELEQELENLRRENEQLASAGETLRRRSDELLSKTESLELQMKEIERTHSEERKVARGQMQSKDRENTEMRGRLEEMEGRLENNFKKIRVRERELEHRLEIVRMESQTLVSTKDKMLLELKRQIDQITLENDYAKQKSQELFNQYKDKQETIRRVVRALRIALTILEGDEDAGGGRKSE